MVLAGPITGKDTAIRGHRAPRWTIELLDSRDRPMGVISTVKEGNLSLSSTDRLGGSAALVIDADIGTQINWARDRCRVVYDPGVPGWEPWSLGVFLFSSPVKRVTNLTVGYECELQTKLAVLDEATTAGPWAAPADTNLVQTVQDLILSTGENRLAVTTMHTAASSSIVYDTGEHLLSVCNDLLTAANYFAVHMDGNGQYILAPYVVPSERPVAWTFARGETAIHSGDWSIEQDHSSVPNRVEVFTPGSEDEDPIIGVATNSDPESPYSVQARDRWVVRREQVEAAGQAEADALAARLLLAGMSPLARLHVSHAMVPIWPRNVVRFRDKGIDTLATVQRMDIDISYDTQVNAEWVEVNALAVSIDGPDQEY